MNFKELCELSQSSDTGAGELNRSLSINMNFLSFICITPFLITNVCDANFLLWPFLAIRTAVCLFNKYAKGLVKSELQ